MPRKKIIGKCRVEGCEREIDSLGLCGLHYRRQYYKGRLHKINNDRRKHRQYYNWITNKSEFCTEWQEFWQFVKDVGEEPPSRTHYLRKIDESKPFSKNNFKWVEFLKKRPEETMKEWNARKLAHRVAKNPTLNRNMRVFLQFGVSLEEYSIIIQKLKDKQGDCCAICNKPETRITQKKKVPVQLAVDHCHKTKKIRGLLCSRCNTTLGRIEDSIPLLQSMIKYLESSR